MDCLTETTEQNINCIILKGHKMAKAFLDCRACALEEGDHRCYELPCANRLFPGFLSSISRISLRQHLIPLIITPY